MLICAVELVRHFNFLELKKRQKCANHACTASGPVPPMEFYELEASWITLMLSGYEVDVLMRSTSMIVL